MTPLQRERLGRRTGVSLYHDLLDQIINPSKEINEQFAPIIVTKNNGEVISGVVVNLNGDGVMLSTDSSDPNQQVSIDRKEVKSIEASKVSPMPPMLLMMLKKEEILDLTAYILSGGDSKCFGDEDSARHGCSMQIEEEYPFQFFHRSVA